MSPSEAGTSCFSLHVTHDAYFTFKMAALLKQVQRKESMVHIHKRLDSLRTHSDERDLALLSGATNEQTLMIIAMIER
jgi:hypothetical protein